MIHAIVLSTVISGWFYFMWLDQEQGDDSE